MDPIHIHNLLRQLTNEVRCPSCKIRVRPNMIHVENSTENYCLLRIRCHACGEIFHGHAHVGIKVASGENVPETVRRIAPKDLPPAPPPISDEELANLEGALVQKISSITEFFQVHA